MLSDNDITFARDILDLSLPDTAILQRNTPTRNQSGGQVAHWAAYGTVCCRVSPLGAQTPQELVLAGKVTSLNAWVITLPAETDITAVERIAVGTRTFEVIAPLTPRSYEVGRRVACREAR